MAEMATDPRHNHLVYPADRRPWIHLRAPYLIALVVLAIGPVVAAWIYYLAFGLPELPLVRAWPSHTPATRTVFLSGCGLRISSICF